MRILHFSSLRLNYSCNRLDCEYFQLNDKNDINCLIIKNNKNIFRRFMLIYLFSIIIP